LATDLAERIDQLASLPYQESPYSARNWGDPLHSLCSYPSKLKPGIAHFLVRLFSAPGEIVFDPFSGSGTIPLEACLLGRRGMGSDLSPLAWLLTAGKTAFSTHEDLQQCLSELRQAIQGSDHVGDGAPEEVRSFYHPRTLNEILIARQVVLKGIRSGQPDIAGAWATIGAAICHLLHGNRPYALSRRSHNIIPIPPRGPVEYKPLLEHLSKKLSRTIIRRNRELDRGAAFQAEASAVPIDTDSVGLIATSPPFLGTTDFLRQNRIRLWFAGWEYERQRDTKEKGDFLEFVRELAPYEAILSEFFRVLRSGGLLVMHLGVVRGTDMAAELEPYGIKAGFAPQGRVYESVDHLESHGRVDRGATTRHAFLVLEKL
jgi:hypothetical protein